MLLLNLYSRSCRQSYLAISNFSGSYMPALRGEKNGRFLFSPRKMRTEKDQCSCGLLLYRRFSFYKTASLITEYCKLSEYYAVVHDYQLKSIGVDVTFFSLIDLGLPQISTDYFRQPKLSTARIIDQSSLQATSNCASNLIIALACFFSRNANKMPS